MKKIFYLFISLLSFMSSRAQQEIPLFEGKVPNSKPCGSKEQRPDPGRVSGVTVPTLTVFLPEKNDAPCTAVLIFPGGGYSRLAIGHEGYDVAKEFNKNGIAAFVVKYRIPNDSCMTNKNQVPLQDAEEAIKMVRERAKEWNINPSRVGILGFSAGGHLASTLGTKYREVYIENKNNTTIRPDFMILGYPVISMSDSLAHKGSRDNLLGKTPDQATITAWSTETQITPDTPPAFLVHAADDKTVNVQNSIVFYQTLLKNKVPAEMHLYQRGGHGFGMNNATTPDKWMDQVLHWMMGNGWR